MANECGSKRGTGRAPRKSAETKLADARRKIATVELTVITAGSIAADLRTRAKALKELGEEQQAHGLNMRADGFCSLASMIAYDLEIPTELLPTEVRLYRGITNALQAAS